MTFTPQHPNRHIRCNPSLRPAQSGGAVGAAGGNAAFRRPRLRIALVALVLVPTLAVPAEADQVGNLDQTSASTTVKLSDSSLAQAFSTGSHHAGYTLERLKVDFATDGANNDQVYINVYRTDSAGRPTGDSVGGMLGVPFATFQKTVKDEHNNDVVVNVYSEFDANLGQQRLVGGIHLQPNTTYVLVFTSGLSYSTAAMRLTAADQQDSGSSSGWSLANNSLSQPRCIGTSCSTAWTSNADALKIQISARRGQRAYPSWLKVADAEAHEGPGATLDFVVTLEPALSKRITVRYRTADIFGVSKPATAGRDYTPPDGDARLTFEPGVTTQIARVPIIDDNVNDDGEQLDFHIFDPSDGASIFRGIARGTIRNTDPIPGPANASPTGAPIISGTPRVGETLSADVSGIGDEDGMANPEFAYTWFREVDDGTWTLSCCGSSTYTLKAADEGHAVYVEVSYTDDTGTRESLTSEPTAAVEGEPADNTPATGAPSISGTARVGEILTASVTDISDADGLDNVSYSYQWIRGSTDIEGAAGSSYTLARADEGERIKVRVSFTDDAGNPESLTSTATDPVAAAPAPDELTASFKNVPESHDGQSTFTFRVEFSENIGTSYRTLRDESFAETNGDVTRARRVNGRSDLWEITVQPTSFEDVTIRLPGGRACDTTGAVCTSGDSPRPLSNSPSDTVDGPPPLTASFTEVPDTHTGEEFTFKLTFSEEPTLSYKTLRNEEAFDITNGTVRKARRRNTGSNLAWQITIEPASDADVQLVLPVTTDCDARGAICTHEGKPLSNRLTATVSGPDSQTSSEGFSLAPENGSPSGIWSDGRTAWVADSEDASLYAYRLSDGSRQPDRDIGTDPAPMGLWSDGETLWVAGLGGGLRAHRLSDGSRLASRDLDLEANTAPAGLWSDGETLWVAEWLGETVHAYRLSGAERIASRDIQLASGNLMPVGVWSDGETLWVADWRERMYAYRLSSGGREPDRDIIAGEEDEDPTGLWSGGDTLLSTSWEGTEVKAYSLPSPLSGSPDAVLSGELKLQASRMHAIADPNLRAAIEVALGKGFGEAVSLEELAGLKTLKARNSGIRDLTGLEGAISLKELDLGFNPLVDLWPLVSLPSLVSLNLDGAAADLSPLAAMTELDRLSLRHNGIDDLQALTGLVSLTELDVGENRIEDLSPLAGLTALKVLRADSNHIRGLWPLAPLTSLQALDLGANHVLDLRPLSGMLQLTTLRLGNNGLTELYPLSGLKGLRELGLAGNSVEDLSALSDLSELRRLDLRGSPVEDLSPLGQLGSLVWVHVGGSQIEDLTPLDALNGLTVAGRDDRNSPRAAGVRHRGTNRQ